MVAINKILLPECTGEGCGGDNEVCTDSRVHHRNAENRAPVTRNRRSAPILGRWLARDPAGYQGGINLYGYVESSPVGAADPNGEEGIVVQFSGYTPFTLAYHTLRVPRPLHEGAFHGWRIQWLITPAHKIAMPASSHDFVIQHMTITVKVFNATTGAPIPSKDVHLNYWEAWHARPGNRVPMPQDIGATGGYNGINDNWVNPKEAGPNTKGQVTYTGSAAFYEGINLQGWSKSAIPASGHLWATTKAPNFQAVSNTVNRKLTVKWNWCENHGREELTYG